MIIDLTHYIEEGMPVYPGTREPKLDIPFTVEEHGFQETSLDILSHLGTHLDCPAHLIKEGLCTDTMPLDTFIGEGVVIDCSNYPPGSEIDVEVIRPHMETIEKVDFILFYTGWSSKWGKEEYFDAFPVPSRALAKQFTTLDLKGVGIDAISIDSIDSTSLLNHIDILGNKMIIIENLENLELLVNKRFELYCLPLKIKSGDGSPIRAVARVIER